MVEDTVDYLIIGAGIAGTTAAQSIRGIDSNSSVVLLSGEPHFLYSRVLLPEFIRGEVNLNKVMMKTADDYKKNGIKIFLDEYAESFEPDRMILQTDKGRKFQAKKVLIASGGKPKPWHSGKNWVLPRVLPIFRLQTLDDALCLKDFLENNPAGEAIVVGGGFMVLEFIEILAHFGWKITLLCKSARFWPDFLDELGSEILTDLWRKNGVELIFGDEIPELREQNGQNRVLTKNGKELRADAMCVGIGLERNLGYIGGYSVSANGIKVNGYLETEFPNVWAAGDVALFPDPFSERMRSGGNWSGAFMQGRVAGLNMSGASEQFKTLCVYSINHLGYVFTFAGDVGPFDQNSGIKSHTAHLHREKKEYVRFFSKNNRVVGAVLINGQKFMSSINQAIMNKWNASKIILDRHL